MVITSIKLVSLPGAPAYQEKVYLAHMDRERWGFCFRPIGMSWNRKHMSWITKRR